MNAEGVISALIIAFLWGSAPILHKFMFNTKPISPETIVVVGGAVYFLCIVLYFLYHRKLVITEMQVVDRNTVMILLFNALVAGFFANYLYYHIIKRYPGHMVSALIYSAPFFTLILAYTFLQEDITPLSFVGVMMIVSGVCLLTFNKAVPLAK